MRRPVVVSTVALALSLWVVAACGSGGSAGSGAEQVTAASDPVPAAMCEPGSSPVVAAYDIDTGAFRWVACAEGGGMFLAAAATANQVWVEQAGATTRRFVLDATTGAVAGDADAADVPDDADYRTKGPPTLDGVHVRGGQDDPLMGVDRTTGEVVWQAEGHPYYDDVWAYGDGAVFVDAWDPTGTTPGSWIAAYEIVSGAERWRWSPDVGYASPWHATGERLFALGADLWVIATSDGTVMWHTSYAPSATGYPRMFGALANDDSVFVSFTTEASGGD